MAIEDAFNAAMGSFSMYGALLKDVAAEVGMDRALELHAKQGEGFGKMMAGMIQDGLGDDELNTETIKSVVVGLNRAFGLSPEIEESPTKVSFKYEECPIYEGMKMAGWEHEEIEAACSCVSAVEIAELSKTFPQISGGLEFRATPDGACIESFSIDA